MGDYDAIFHHPLVRLKGGEITVGSVLLGLLILSCTWLAGVAVDRAVRRLALGRGLEGGIEFALSRIARYLVALVGGAIAVSTAGVDLTALLAASTVLLVGIGFGLQNIAQNFISGLIVLIEQPVRKGDFIRVGDAYGVVDDIGLRATRVITRDQVTIIVPNSQLIGGQVVNHSKPTPNLRIAVRVGAAYGSDTALVRETLLAVAKGHERLLAEPAPEVRLEDFGDSSLDFALLAWIGDPGQDLRIASELRFRIDEAFRKAGLAIPFPQRDVHLRGQPPAKA